VIKAAFLVILLSASVCSAQSNWQQLGIDEFAVAANSQIEVLVSSHGRWMSRSNGEDWKLRVKLPGPAFRVILDEAGKGLITGKGYCVITSDGFRTTNLVENGTGIYFQPVKVAGDTIFANSVTVLVRSVNGGIDWDTVATPFPIYSVTFSDGLHGVISSAEGRLARTFDAGSTWEMTPLQPSSSVNLLAVGNGYLFAFTKAERVLRSADWGSTWDSVQLSGELRQQTSALCLAGDGSLIAGGGSSVLRSTDSGRSWQCVKIHDPYTTASSRSLATVGNKIIAAGTEAAIFESYDYGKTWAITATANMVGFGDYAPSLFGASLWKDSVLYLASQSAQVRWSTNRGLTYSVRRLPIAFSSPMTVHRASENVVIIGGLDGLLLRSTDTGNTWKQLEGMPYEGFYRIVQTGSRLWMTGGKYILISDDAGESWKIQDSLGYLIADLIVLRDGRLAAVGRTGQSPDVQAHFSISDAARTSWINHFVPNAPGLLGLSQLTGDSLIACGRYGTIAVSGDMGTSWVASNAGTNDVVTKIVYVNDSLIVAGTPNGVIESYDRGSTWVRPEMPVLVRPRPDEPLTQATDVRVTSDGRVYAVGDAFILVRDLKPEEQEHAYIWTPKSNPWLRARLYPNPSTIGLVTADVWGLHSLQGVKRQLRLYDILGRSVLDLSDQINRDLQALTLEIQIETRDLAKGPYMLVLDAGGDRMTEQLVVY
jgi:photosystem II stability/assembly factor-like uncharacterized protein